MKTRLMALLGIVAAAFLSTGTAGAVMWKGLNWNTYGASTTAVVNVNGGLDITVLGGQSGDPGHDNWVLHSLLPANLTQANAPWVEFKFQDTFAGDNSVGGARGFVDTDINSWNTETMWQGGVYAGYSTYFLNHNVYDAPSGGWAHDPDNWFTGPLRTAGEHTVKYGMLPDGTVDMWFDGVLCMTLAASPDCTFFKRMYLGVSAMPDTTFTATYNDLQFGTNYARPVPEPVSVSLSLLGLLSLTLVTTRRRPA